MRLLLMVGALVVALLRPTLQASNADSQTYVGGVVEYHTVYDEEDGEKAAQANANNYQRMMKSAAQNNVDIVVFPEYTLTSIADSKRFNITAWRSYFRKSASYSPDPKKELVLCDQTDLKYKKSLKSISCSAKDLKIYTVVNHFEIEDCPESNPNCSYDGVLLYNSNFVFDRNGRLIARYRKANLLNELGTNVTAEPELVTFVTDFNVTFGLMTCQDLFNEKPALSFVKKPNVTDVVVTTQWYDTRPFGQALEYQAGWSFASDVNLLVSGANRPDRGISGSGMYAGRSGPILTFRTRRFANALVIAEIPKLNRRNRVDNPQTNNDTQQIIQFSPQEVPTYDGAVVSKQEKAANVFRILPDVSAYALEPIDTSLETSQVKKVCNRKVCCEFHVELTFDRDTAEMAGVSYYRYQMAVFNGVSNLGNGTTAGVEACGIISCAGPEPEDCHRDFPPDANIVRPIRLETLIIQRLEVDMSDRSLYMPLTMTRDYEPLSNEYYGYLESGHRSSSMLLITLAKPRDDIMTFAIFGRTFDRDKGAPTVEGSACLAFPSLGLFLAALMLSTLLY